MMKSPKLLPWQAAANLCAAELVYKVTGMTTKEGGSAAGLLMIGASRIDDDWLSQLRRCSNVSTLKYSKILGFEDTTPAGRWGEEVDE